MCFSQKLSYRCRIALKTVMDQWTNVIQMQHAGFLIFSKNGVRTTFEQSDEMAETVICNNSTSNVTKMYRLISVENKK